MGVLGRVQVRSADAAGEHLHQRLILRRHRLGIGLYDREGERLVRREYVEIDVDGERTEVKEVVGMRQPDLLLLNDADLTYAKIRLDDRSLATVIGSLSALEDSLARALCWSAVASASSMAAEF